MGRDLQEILEDLNQCDRNYMLLAQELHHEFDRLLLWFEQTDDSVR